MYNRALNTVVTGYVLNVLLLALGFKADSMFVIGCVVLSFAAVYLSETCSSIYDAGKNMTLGTYHNLRRGILFWFWVSIIATFTGYIAAFFFI